MVRGWGNFCWVKPHPVLGPVCTVNRTVVECPAGNKQVTPRIKPVVNVGTVVFRLGWHCGMSAQATNVGVEQHQVNNG